MVPVSSSFCTTKLWSQHSCEALEEEGRAKLESLVSIFKLSQGWTVAPDAPHATSPRRHTHLPHLCIPVPTLLLLQDLYESQIFTKTLVGGCLLFPTSGVLYVPRVSARLANSDLGISVPHPTVGCSYRKY